MSTDSPPTVSSKAMFWFGWVLTALAAAGLTASGILKFNMSAENKKGLQNIGWKEEQVPNLAIVELTCAAIYLFPPTSVLGAILVTGYLGGAVATHVRVHEGFAPPLILAVIAWGGLYLRDARLRALVPWKK